MNLRKSIIVPTIAIFMVMLACNLPAIAQPTTGAEGIMTVAAKTVQVELTQSASGNPTTSTSPQALPTARPTITLPAVAPTSPPPLPSATTIPCDRAIFGSDVTIPDDTELSANSSFTKTWRIRNGGSCTWTTSYSVVLESGDAMGAPASTNLTTSVAPGQDIEISLKMVAPATPGDYRGNWKLRNSSGTVFGLLNGGPFYVDIKSVIPTPVTATPGVTVVYDFVANYCMATWNSNIGMLPCPGPNTDDRGFVLKIDSPKLENGGNIAQPSIETHPLWGSNAYWDPSQHGGWIQGTFPEFSIPSGAHLKTQIGCLYNSGGSTCDVNFNVRYSADGGDWQALGPSSGWNQTYDGMLGTLDIDLSSLAGKSVTFLLYVDANDTEGQDWAVWIAPKIVK